MKILEILVNDIFSSLLPQFSMVRRTTNGLWVTNGLQGTCWHPTVLSSHIMLARLASSCSTVLKAKNILLYIAFPCKYCVALTQKLPVLPQIGMDTVG